MDVTRLASALRTADIAHPAHGLDDSGAAGVFDLGTQVRDVHVDVVGVAHVFEAQRLVRDALAREHGLGMRHKQGENVELAGREHDGRAADRDFAAVGVERDRVHGERSGGGQDGSLGRVADRGHRSGADAHAVRHTRPGAGIASARSRPHGLRALQRHADPCEQLLNRKWLGQVIVGAGIEPGYLVHYGIARGNHNHRHVLVLADTSQDLHAVELRQQYIEQDQIVVALQRQVHGGAAVGGVLHLVALVLQLECHKAGDFLLVLYDQDPCHACPPSAITCRRSDFA